MELRDYQVEAIKNARAELASGKKRVLIVAPTGSGKTVVAAAIIRSAVEKGKRIVFLAHRKELITQTSEKLHAFGVRHGIIKAGFAAAPQHSVQVASVQTLARRAGAAVDADLVFIDEAHHVTSANTYQKLLDRWPRARAIGLTATPWRLDGRGLSDLFDAHVLSTTPWALRDQGWLVPVGGWIYEATDSDGANIPPGMPDIIARNVAASFSMKLVTSVL